MLNSKLNQSITKMRGDSKRRVVVLDDAIMTFLMTITQPADLDHTASLADFIRNNTLEEIRRKIVNAENKRSY